MNAEGHGDEQRAQAEREGDVAPPIDAAGAMVADFAQAAKGPERTEDADRHVHPEDGAPIEDRQDAAGDQPEKLSRKPGDLVYPEREAALI